MNESEKLADGSCHRSPPVALKRFGGPPSAPPVSTGDLDSAIARAAAILQSHQAPEGYWWYTLQANETIGAEMIFLEHCMGIRTPQLWERLGARMVAEQLADGGWPLAHGLPGDLSTTLECYVALRMAGWDREHATLTKARAFITTHGGLANARVFTQVHFAQLGLTPWDWPPVMPIDLVLAPAWSPLSVYSFSSWARACIIPLLVVMTKKPVWPTLITDLGEELGDDDLVSPPKYARQDIWASFFIWVDRAIKIIRPFTGRLTERRPTKERALAKAEQWIREHLARTEDIFPAMAYGALALRALGYQITDPTIRQALIGLERFRQSYSDGDAHGNGALTALPFASPTAATYHAGRVAATDTQVHQQCCISPGWDTPWAMCALRASGVAADDAGLQRSCDWLLSQQVTGLYGDWQKKNPDGKPGGWSFEFLNDYFPDTDDTLQIILALESCRPQDARTRDAMMRAVDWCVSMQNDDGGWGAFDKNNSLALVNKIPFSDHGACLDPSSPDIAGRMIRMLATQGYTLSHPVIDKALKYLRKNQEVDGSWFGRWGVNYLYGTWAVLCGLERLGYPRESSEVQRAAAWIASVQNPDGGFGESVMSYPEERFVAAPSTASQTAWALMGLMAAGKASESAAQRAADWLLRTQQADGTWAEHAYTGTGFPGHFYIRYHGYRHFFPLMALGLWRQMQA